MKYFRVTFTVSYDKEYAAEIGFNDDCPLIGYDASVSMSFPIGKNVPHGITTDFTSVIESKLLNVRAPVCVCECGHDAPLNVSFVSIELSKNKETEIAYTKHLDDDDCHISDSDDKKDDMDNVISSAVPLSALKNYTKIEYNSHWNCWCQKPKAVICGCGCDKEHDGWGSKTDAGMVSAIDRSL
jgi:hypothetical protein